MEKIKELKANYLSENQYVRKTTLDLNDLLKRRSDEKKTIIKKIYYSLLVHLYQLE